jgi:predicted MFS family arabinose efflux permease
MYSMWGFDAVFIACFVLSSVYLVVFTVLLPAADSPAASRAPTPERRNSESGETSDAVPSSPPRPRLRRRDAPARAIRAVGETLRSLGYLLSFPDIRASLLESGYMSAASAAVSALAPLYMRREMGLSSVAVCGVMMLPPLASIFGSMYGGSRLMSAYGLRGAKVCGMLVAPATLLGVLAAAERPHLTNGLHPGANDVVSVAGKHGAAAVGASLDLALLLCSFACYGFFASFSSVLAPLELDRWLVKQKLTPLVASAFSLMAVACALGPLTAAPFLALIFDWWGWGALCLALTVAAVLVLIVIVSDFVLFAKYDQRSALRAALRGLTPHPTQRSLATPNNNALTAPRAIAPTETTPLLQLSGAPALLTVTAKNDVVERSSS